MHAKQGVRSQEGTRGTEKDLLNGPRHCFSIHTDCSANFCTTVQASQQPASSSGNINAGGEEENGGGEESAFDDDILKVS